MLETELSLDTELLNYSKIDAHAHITIRNGKLNQDQLDMMLEDYELMGVKKTCVSIPHIGTGSESATPDVIAAANDIVAEAVTRYPDRVLGYAFLHCGYPDRAQQEMERCLAIDGIIGIKLYHQYLFNDPIVTPVIEAAAEKNALILLHQGKVMDEASKMREPSISDGYHIAELARKVPAARIICGHIGGGGDWEWSTKALKDVPSVYIDTSGSVIDAGAVELAAETLGPERMLFATDMSFEEGLGKVLAAKVDREDKKSIFHDNFNNLLTEVTQ